MSVASSPEVDPAEAAKAAGDAARAARQAARDAHEAVGMVDRLHRRTLIAMLMGGTAFILALFALMGRWGG